MNIEYRTRAVIHLDRLERNVERIKKLIGPDVELIAVLKGDAYGHGIDGVFPAFKKCGIKSYAVAIAQEGVRLRKCGAADEFIMILGDSCNGSFADIAEYNLTPAIFDYETARELDAAAREHNKLVSIEIKIDTGMSRIGFKAGKDCVEQIKKISELPNLRIAGAFTHFVAADELDNPLTEKQLSAFESTIELLKDEGVSIPKLHVANSPAAMLRPNTYLDAVRVGDAVFGLCPIEDSAWKQSGFEEVMTWNSYVALVKTIPAGSVVGYGATYVAAKDTRVATIPVGFADGYSRELSNIGVVVINGEKAPVIGRICMDQFMVDVTDIRDVSRGTRVELLGNGFGILDMANLLDRNVDEIVCAVTARVPRYYTENERELS